MEPELVRMPRVPRPTSVVVFVLVFLGLVLLIGGGPIRTVPAGNVGVKDFFGQVSASTLSPGVNVVVPLTTVVKMSIQTQEIKEVAEVLSQAGRASASEWRCA